VEVAFTGSTEVGRLIVQAAAGNLKKVSLELGGKSPNIVFDDANAGAIEGAANAIFFNHGQCCVAGSRLFVQQGRFDEVVDGVSEIAKSIKLGSGMDEGTQMGPDDIAAAANDSEYGLGAGIWTRDISKAHALAKKIRAGTVWVNCYNVFDASLPFGGYKQSGWGREMGHEVLEAYTEVKAVTTQL
jgi:acyl-CoA reductase-like NAD-dependent aldehyde dehydrogenase